MDSYIYFDEFEYGTIGELVTSYLHNMDINLYVGDIVEFEYRGFTRRKVVAKYENNYGFIGFVINNLNMNNLTKIKYHKLLTENELREIEDSYGYEIKLK